MKSLEWNGWINGCPDLMVNWLVFFFQWDTGIQQNRKAVTDYGVQLHIGIQPLRCFTMFELSYKPMADPLIALLVKNGLNMRNTTFTSQSRSSRTAIARCESRIDLHSIIHP